MSGRIRTSAGTVLRIFAAVLWTTFAQAADFPFKDGDRVMFLGDSITEQYQYSTDLELYLTTRFPQWRLTFLNAGIGGDTAQGGANRFTSHVLAEKPTVLTINFGMNDAGYQQFNADRQKVYLEHTEKMLAAANAAGVRTVLMSPNAVDRRKSPQFSNFAVYVETQKQFYAPLAELAVKHKVQFVDQYATTRAAVERMETDKADQVIPYYDGFHTASPGGLLMAHSILTGVSAPAVVSDVKISGAAADAKNCDVSNLAVEGKTVRFTRLDRALPLPVQADWATLLPYVNHLKDLNWYGVSVAGLPEGKYSISIDNVPVIEATAVELAAGVNVGNVSKGPVFDQANKAFGAINQKNGQVHQRFRGVVMFNPPDWLADVANPKRTEELQKRMERIQSLQAEVYQAVQPVARRWEIKPAS